MAQAKEKAPTFASLCSIRALLRVWVLPAKDMKRRTWPLAIGLGYIAAIYFLGGLRGDHVMIGMLCLLDYYNEKSRLFLRFFLPFILTGVVYDSMRYFYWQGIAGHVHVAGPYFRDKRWFGIGGLTPNEYLDLHQSVVFDLLCGFAYITFVWEYLCVAFFMFFTGAMSVLRTFGWCFFTANVMGFITYFIYPAAPPWYVSQYGLGPARMDIHPSPAAAHRFDVLLGTHFFDQMYGRGVDVFGAYPSLHVAYPFLVVWASFQVPALKAFRPFAILFYLLMCFSAVYLQHHYVVDIIMGTIYASIAVVVVQVLLNKFAQPVQISLAANERPATSS